MEDYIEEYKIVIRGDTRSFDYSSNANQRQPLAWRELPGLHRSKAKREWT